MFWLNSVDVKCPICGAMNESLNLEETDGWMECESCGNAVQIMKYVKFLCIQMTVVHNQSEKQSEGGYQFIIKVKNYKRINFRYY